MEKTLKMYRLSQNILLIIFLMAFACSFGQTKELDSLKMLIDKSNKDNINYLLAMGMKTLKKVLMLNIF